MGFASVYIDGGYLDKVLFHQFPGQRIDMGQLASEMGGQEDLLRAYYYHCLPYQSNTSGTPALCKHAQIHHQSKLYPTIPGPAR